MTFAGIDAFIQEQAIDTKRDRWRTRLPMPPVQSFEAGKELFWELQTNHGPIKVRLMPDVAPMHVTSTVYLTKLGYYDDLAFHRVIPGFMAQGGCPLGTGTGGPGYTFDGEFSPSVRHTKGGLLSMANAGPGTDGSQFFLTFVETPWLDDKHTVFGEIVEGMDTMGALEKRGTGNGQTTEELKIETASITEA